MQRYASFILDLDSRMLFPYGERRASNLCSVSSITSKGPFEEKKVENDWKQLLNFTRSWKKQ